MRISNVDYWQREGADKNGNRGPSSKDHEPHSAQMPVLGHCGAFTDTGEESVQLLRINSPYTDSNSDSDLDSDSNLDLDCRLNLKVLFAFIAVV